jgi:hypothetical protein
LRISVLFPHSYSFTKSKEYSTPIHCGSNILNCSCNIKGGQSLVQSTRLWMDMVRCNQQIASEFSAWCRKKLCNSKQWNKCTSRSWVATGFGLMTIPKHDKRDKQFLLLILKSTKPFSSTISSLLSYFPV